MRPLAVVLALELAAPPDAEMSPGTSAEPVAAPLSGSPPAEGPAPSPGVDLSPRTAAERQPAGDPNDPNDWWHRRDRRFLVATAGLGTGAGGALLAGGGLLIVSSRTRGPAGETSAAGLGLVVIGVVALGGLVGVGTAWGVTRARGWRPPPARYLEKEPSEPRDEPRYDPRRDPAWVAHDRTLRGTTIGLGVLTGAALVSIPLTLRFVERGMGSSCPEPTGCVAWTPSPQSVVRGVAVVSEVLVASLSLAGLITAGALWSAHRRPLRRWKMAPTAGGLQIQF